MMGGNESKDRSGNYKLPKKDNSGLSETFNKLSGGSPQCKEKAFQGAWKDVDKYLRDIIIKYYFSEKKEINFDTFVIPFVCMVYGSPDDKAAFLNATLKSDGVITPDCIKKLVKIILTRFLNTSDNFDEWISKGFQVSESRLDLHIEHLCEDLPKSPSLSAEELESWVANWSSFQAMTTVVFHQLYELDQPDQCDISIPECIVNLPGGYKKPLIDISSVLFLNSYLPPELRDVWRFLFSSSVHGESFSKLLGGICNKGASVIIVKDKSSFVFGGFAPTDWRLGPKFFGDKTSFLFQLQPNMKIFQPTGYNANYQYMNLNQQTLPNGLGMGGQLRFFALWIDAEFGKGHSSESCTTYQKYNMLSETKEFSIDCVEVWGVGPPPEIDEPETRPSVLKDAKHKESDAMMKLLGRGGHSEGMFETEK